MAESLIPGLDGDLPMERGHLPDSLRLKKKTNGEARGYEVQQSSGDPPSDRPVTHPQVGMRGERGRFEIRDRSF